ncbi:MAG: peroxiredoxin [Ignavibacteriae bacterium]|nr:peroxiredoxin [Ignavibacteriota bacterium]
MPLKVGDKAPDFTLHDTEKKQRKLSEFLGKKVVVAFFPGAFTGVCTNEMCALRDSFGELGGINTNVVAISVDAPAANKAFAETHRLGFPLLSDYTREVSKQYCGIYPDFGGLPGLTAAKRSVFVLDPSGTVRYAWITENPGTEPNYDEVKKAVASI